ncbi:MAG TPA: metal-dependent transcriptional regulator [Methanomicrobiales archaeon]|nr:metal-dependent transcriptional regulator [Methanomicrobiales archaeon]
MKRIDGLEVSQKKAEYLKYILEQGERARTKEIADHFSVSPSTITKVLEDLAQHGFVVHTPYYGVVLTPMGKEYAGFLLRRHRLLSLALTHFGLDEDEACNEAKKFEAYVSKEVIDRICASFGHPVMGICGPIEHDTCCCCPEHLACESQTEAE